jgi:hypothetical protein
MKKLKLSKTSWLILAAGIFVVVLGSLGITRSQQLGEKSKLDEDLSLATTVLEKLQDSANLQTHLDELQRQIEEGEVLLDEAKQRLDQTVVSVDVADELFVIADYCGVVVRTLTTSPIKPNEYEGIGLDMTSMNILADGDLDNLINFVTSLNDDYTTGLIRSFQISIPDSSVTDNSTLPNVNIQMTIYSYEGNDNG